MDLSELARALRDTAQSASNAVASNVSGPVDLIAAALRKAGVPVPQDAVGGSEWMARKGLTREVPMGAPRLVGETLGLAGPIAVQAKAPQIAAAANKMVDNAMAPRVMNPQAGAIVWHGSPHRFTKFDSSKIGTGEGAQAYGHGIYTAESKKVGDEYRKALSGIDLKYADDASKAEATKMMPWGFPDPAAAIKTAAGSDADVAGAIQYLRTHAGGGDPYRKAHAEHLAKMLESGAVTPEKAGYLYKIDLPDEQIARMLDWDKPLGQQAPEVRSALSSLGYKYDPAASSAFDDALLSALQGGPTDLPKMPSNPMGSEIARGKGIFDQPQDKVIADRLRAAGIPGIRYLDQGSRGAGQGTSNFVVFPGNEDMLKILEINGQPVQAVIDALRNNR
jgi:hypothetical protein